MKVPIRPEEVTIRALRLHIAAYGWSGRYPYRSLSNRALFDGQCACAVAAVSELLTGGALGNWFLRVRGWYKGEITAIHGSDASSNFRPGGNFKAHAHSWVKLPDGRILDPTWWQFTNAPVKVYIWELYS